MGDVQRGYLEFVEAEAGPILHHHLKAPRLAEPADRRRDDDNGLRLLQFRQGTVDAGDNLPLRQIASPFFPVLKDDKRGGDRDHIGSVQEGVPPYGDPVLNSGDFCKHAIDFVGNRLRPRLRRARRQPG